MRSAVLPSQSDGIALAVNFGSEFVLLLKTGKNNLVENSYKDKLFPKVVQIVDLAQAFASKEF